MSEPAERPRIDLDAMSNDELRAEAFRLLLGATQQLTMALEITFALSQPTSDPALPPEDAAGSLDEEEDRPHFLGGKRL